MRAADALGANGILAMPVRPPTVARGSSRLRVTLSSDHTDGEIDHLVKLLREGGFAGQSPTGNSTAEGNADGA